jgi:hypothetical protein
MVAVVALLVRLAQGLMAATAVGLALAGAAVEVTAVEQPRLTLSRLPEPMAATTPLAQVTA